MKNMKSFFCTSLISMLFPCFLYAQNYYVYPVNPSTKSWGSLTLKERIAVQQIPEEKLKNMTTDEVFQAWIDLPGRLEVLAFSTMQKGFEITKKRYNVLSELLNRKDVGSIVLMRYFKIDPDGFKKETKDIEKGRFVTDIGFTELLLSQSEVLNNLTRIEKKQLLKDIMRKMEKKQNYSDKEKEIFWLESGLILAGRLIKNDNNSEFKQILDGNNDVKNALDRGEITSKPEYEKLYNAVINITKNY